MSKLLATNVQSTVPHHCQQELVRLLQSLPELAYVSEHQCVSVQVDGTAQAWEEVVKVEASKVGSAGQVAHLLGAGVDVDLTLQPAQVQFNKVQLNEAVRGGAEGGGRGERWEMESFSNRHQL